MIYHKTTLNFTLQLRDCIKIIRRLKIKLKYNLIKKLRKIKKIKPSF